jgi:hypothetical protein
MTNDPTELPRRIMSAVINSAVESEDKQKERVRLEAKFGQVWNTDEVQRDFEITGFMAPFCIVVRKSDGARGLMAFQHMPRFYFDFRKD